MKQCYQKAIVSNGRRDEGLSITRLDCEEVIDGLSVFNKE